MPLRLNYLATESGFEIVRVARFFEAPADVGDDFKTLGRGAPLAAMGLKETVTAPLVHVVEANTKPCTGYPHLNDVREVLLSMAGIVVNFAAFIRSPTDQCLSGAMWSTANRVSGLPHRPRRGWLPHLSANRDGFNQDHIPASNELVFHGRKAHPLGTGCEQAGLAEFLSRLAT